MEIKESSECKVCIAKDYNYVFSKTNGYFERWGKTRDDDPQYSPYGPEIADIEISTICTRGCKTCYKSNTQVGKNMSIGTFKKVFTALPNTLTQIAFGIGDIDANTDLEEILKYTRAHGVVPNITINGDRITPYYYDMLTTYCGAVAVSMYDYKKCLNTIKELRSRGIQQTNIHMIASEETVDDCVKLIERLNKTNDSEYVNAVVFLQLKPIGVRNTSHPLSKVGFNKIVDASKKNMITVGFDSCSAPIIYDCYDEKVQKMIEPCESGCFSIYINVDGKVFPCSFTEQLKGADGIDITGNIDFMKDVWNGELFTRFRDTLSVNKCENGCRCCPAFNLYDDDSKVVFKW